MDIYEGEIIETKGENRRRWKKKSVEGRKGGMMVSKFGKDIGEAHLVVSPQ